MSFGTELHNIWKITLIRISASINYFIEAFQSANEYVQIIQIYAENFVLIKYIFIVHVKRTAFVYIAMLELV